MTNLEEGGEVEDTKVAHLEEVSGNISASSCPEAHRAPERILVDARPVLCRVFFPLP